MSNPRVMKSAVVAALVGLLTAGCATTARTNRILLDSSQRAADKLALNLDQPVGAGGMLVASFVNVDDMYDSSSFGRIVSEQVASGLASAPHLFPITEVKLRQNIFLKEKAGEFLLSREVMDVSRKHDVQAVLVGTYAIGNVGVFVSARIVNPATNQIVSSYDYSLPLDDNFRQLLGYKRIHRPGWWGRLWGDKDVWSKADREYYKYYPDYL